MTADPPNFVTTCTNGRYSMLARREVHEAFVAFAQRGETHGAYVGAYVIMPDHLHLFVALEPALLLSPWMKSLKNSLSKALRTCGIKPPHWQKGFFDQVLRSEESYGQKRGVRPANPVRAGLAKSWEDWRFGGEIHRLECRE